MTANLIKETIKSTGSASGVGANGINVKTLLDKAEDGDRVGMGAATVAIAAGIAGTAYTIVDKVPESKWSKGLMGSLIVIKK